MALLDDINRLLRDHTGYTGDGQGGRGDLPVGDRSTARYVPNMRDWRELLKTIAQTLGDPGALGEILTELGRKASSSELAMGLAGKLDAERLDDRVGATAPAPIVPIAVQSGRAVLWSERGLLGARGLTDALKQAAVSDLAPAAADVPGIVPLIAVGGRVALWLEEGRLSGPGLDATPAGATPLATGEETLWPFTAALERLRSGEARRIRVAFTGDSWSDLATIPMMARELFSAQGFTVSNAPGWISVLSSPMLASRTKSGWAEIDGHVLPVTFPYGAGPDGGCAWTNGTSAVFEITGIDARVITIYHWRAGGAYRYSINGGAYVSVQTGFGGGPGKVTVSLGPGVHNLRIDTVGNAGIVSLLGFYASSHEEAGVEVLKIGNSGSTGAAMRQYLPYGGDVIADISPDLIINILGTNDHKSTASTPAVYRDALEQLADAVRAAAPTCPLIFVAPPRNGGAGSQRPLDLYRDTAAASAHDLSAGFFNACELWPEFTASQAAGLWADLVHLNPAGARLLLRQLNQQLLKM